ncbi:MAG: preprotein translocase subunit YajC [Opitutales bacterium]
MNTLSPLFFAQSAPADPAAGGALFQLLFIILLFGGMYFLIIAPQRKRQKEHEKMVKALKVGDQIVTTGGIYGSVTAVKDDRLVIQIAEQTKVELNRNFIHSKIADKGA